MRILNRDINPKTRAGAIKMIAAESEDMYYCYNLIVPGDLLTASTSRNVVVGPGSGATKSRVNMNITIEVSTIEFDQDTCSLRINGKNVKKNEFIKMGQFHNLDIVVDEPFTLEKECWDAMFMETLNEACEPSRKADVAVIVMQEGIANICLISSVMTFHKAKIEKNIPKKRADNKRDKALEQFFEEIYESMIRHVHFEAIKVVLVASPGFLNADFVQFAMNKASSTSNQFLLQQRSKFITCHSSSGYVSSIQTIISDAIQNQESNKSGKADSNNLASLIKDTKAREDVEALARFNRMLASDESKVSYGLKSVENALQQGAIEQLLVSDSLFRSPDPRVRNNYISLIEEVRKGGGKVFKLSSQHASGVQLNYYCGVAAILRFPIYEEEISASESKSSAVASVFSPAVNSGGRNIKPAEESDDEFASDNEGEPAESRSSIEFTESSLIDLESFLGF